MGHVCPRDRAELNVRLIDAADEIVDSKSISCVTRINGSTFDLRNSEGGQSLTFINGEIVSLRIEIDSGNPVQYLIDWGDNDSVNETFTNFTRSVDFGKQFANDGQFEITVNISNALGWENAAFTISVLTPITEHWVMNGSERHKIQDGEWTFTLELNATEDIPLPTGANVKCDWGDGTPIHETLLTAPPMSIGHDYVAAGRYQPECIIENGVSNRTVTLSVLVLNVTF